MGQEKNGTKSIKFLRLYIVDVYNHGMGHVDVADQLRGVYRMDHWLHNFKWWHAMFWWGFQVLLVNSYLIYKQVYEASKCKHLEHYEFRKDVAMGWIDHDNYGAGKNPGYQTPSDHETVSTMSASSTNRRRQKVTDLSLDPTEGALKCRINCAVGHWPSKPPVDKHGNKTACQIHKWTSGQQMRKGTAICETCNVSLCLECYEQFHTVWDLVKEKQNIAKRIRESGNSGK